MDQLREYETQLADVEALLQATPDDPSLLSLKSDLSELLKITRESLPAEEAEEAAAGGGEAAVAPVSVSASATGTASADPTSSNSAETSGMAAANAYAAAIDDALKRTEAPTESTAAEPAKKKSKKIKDFEVPEHLIPLDTDTDPEKKSKYRALKALKSKHREKKKEQESEKKQKSWQSFHKKKKKKDKSIFATQDGSTKVGVVSAGRNMTEFGERKRHQS